MHLATKFVHFFFIKLQWCITSSHHSGSSFSLFKERDLIHICNIYTFEYQINISDSPIMWSNTVFNSYCHWLIQKKSTILSNNDRSYLRFTFNCFTVTYSPTNNQSKIYNRGHKLAAWTPWSHCMELFVQQL